MDQLTAEHFIEASNTISPFKPYTNRFATGQIGNDKFHYISREFNQFNKVFGEDVIVDNVTCAVSNTTTDVIININPGKIITDDVFCEFNGHTEIVYSNAYIYNPDGYFVLMSDFKNYTTLNRNMFRFMLAYFDSNGNPIDDFDANRNRLVFGVYQIVKSGSNIDYVDVYSEDSIILDGNTYIIRPESFNPLMKSFRVDGGMLE